MSSPYRIPDCKLPPVEGYGIPKDGALVRLGSFYIRGIKVWWEREGAEINITINGETVTLELADADSFYEELGEAIEDVR